MSERLMILKMLSEGKITAEEADALLEALGANLDELNSDYSSKKLHREHHRYNDEIRMERDLEKIDEGFERFEEALDDLEEHLDEKIEELEDKLEELEDEFEDADDEGQLTEEERAKFQEKIAAAQAKLEKERQRIEVKRKEVNERRKRLHEEQNKLRREYQSKHGLSFDIQEGLDEIAKGFREFKRSLQGEGMDELKSAVKDFSKNINDGIVKELKEGLDEGAREVQKAFKGMDFKKVLNNIFSSFNINIGDGIIIEEDIHGEFDPSQGQILIDLNTFNGRIEVVGNDEPGYRLGLKYNIHADSEEEAHMMKKDMCTITQTPTLLQLESHRIRGGVSATLYIPKKLEADYTLTSSNGRITVYGIQQHGQLKIETSNGRIELTELRVREVIAKTSNGRIEIKDLAADEIEARTSNGSIYFDGLCTDVICKTSNGTITAYPHVTDKGNLDLNTSNGRIKVVVPNPEIAVDVDAETTMGGITIDIPELVYQKKIEKNMRKEYQAQSANYIGSAKRVQILAQTSMGSIYIGQSDE